MPELPEVEVVRRGLARWVAGRRVAAVEVRHPRAVRRHAPGAADFAGRLAGATVVEARRRGKYLWLPLGRGDGTPPAEALLGHLGMSGQLLVLPAEAPDGPHLRVRMRFADGGPELRYVDQRTFGGLSVGPLVSDGGGVAESSVPALVAHIAPDPLEPGFDVDTFTAALRRRRTGIKRALLDQSLISGVGNIYADEALWRVPLHFARSTETLTRPTVARLVAAVRAVMGEALERGGTSFDSMYVDVNGESGYFDRSLAAYGRRDAPCPRCGTPIRRDPFMNRSAFTCPRCQPRPRRGRW